MARWNRRGDMTPQDGPLITEQEYRRRLVELREELVRTLTPVRIYQTQKDGTRIALPLIRLTPTAGGTIVEVG